jgi:hypothetical protein
VRAQTEMEALSDEASLIALGLTEAEARERIERKAGRREAAMTSFQSAFDRGDIGGE